MLARGASRIFGQARAANTRLAAQAAGGNALAQQTRGYFHFWRCTPDEFELPSHSMPTDIREIMKNPDIRELDFLEQYWYWRVRKESTVLNPDKLIKTNYKQLAFDMGMPVVNEALEHHIGLVELYEYLKSSPFIGPFGTVENPALVPSVADHRTVGCTGGVGDNEHYPLWFNCRDGFLYRCGECDQVFMLVRVYYWRNPAFDDDTMYECGDQRDPDIDDVFDINLLDKGHLMWNEKYAIRWHLGAQAVGAIPTPIDQLDYQQPEHLEE